MSEKDEKQQQDVEPKNKRLWGWGLSYIGIGLFLLSMFILWLIHYYFVVGYANVFWFVVLRFVQLAMPVMYVLICAILIAEGTRYLQGLYWLPEQEQKNVAKD